MILAVCCRWNATESYDEPAEQEDAEVRTPIYSQLPQWRPTKTRNREMLISAT